ncbi:hypothetical protein [Plantibacter sp. CFBP 13570]|uniref:hypothetical protein n=1 Tax=Plantibacter sp. CFBP 13570 TaxID=2775272 RepID=UPI0019309B79|nr:hypothetical protein [Plantibacter sp. CFBP 13570]MBD8535666.1 hypothetical protein [Plantibacter sp. CFBP 13570]
MLNTLPPANIHVFAAGSIHILHALSATGTTTESHLARMTSTEIVDSALPALLDHQTISRDDEGRLSLNCAVVNTSVDVLRDYLLI